MNCSIKSGIFIDDWKRARVTPLYKAGEDFLHNNYRLVLFYLSLAKLMKGMFTTVFMNILDNAISSMKK